MAKKTGTPKKHTASLVRGGATPAHPVAGVNRTDWEARPPWLRRRPWLADVLAVLVMYLVTLSLFWPYVSGNVRFSAGGDAAAARAWNDVGAQIDAEVDGPAAWNPYVFLGHPTYGSLTYHPREWLNPIEWVVQPFKFLFGGNILNREVFYFFLSGLTMFLFARGVGIPWWGALLAGLTFLLNPYNISLAEAGHGSKQWTITMMPLVLLLTHRMLNYRRLLDMGLLGLGVAALLLSLHVQIAYYALVMSGVYALVWFIRELMRDRMQALRGFGGFAGGSLLGLGLSFYLYLPIYVFAKYSIRGAPPLRSETGSGGLDWEYATAWSLHPLETLQFLIPGLYGLGGSSMVDRSITPETAIQYNLYWGWMPFTQSSLYMGIIPLILAILAAVWLWRHNTVVRWMAVSAVVAVVVSFGSFLPVLYKPLYLLLPYFDKFRVPSMALVVTAAGVSILAGFGLLELVRKISDARHHSASQKSLQRIIGGLMVLAALGVIYAVVANDNVPGSGFVKAGEAERYDPETMTMVVALRWSIFTYSLRTTAMILFLFSAAALVALKARKREGWPAMLLIGVTVLVTAVDLAAIDRRFMHPVPANLMGQALNATEGAEYLKSELQRAEEPFRILPAEEFQSNYWMYHRIPSIGGYAANKLRIYQDLLDYGLFGEAGQPNLGVAGLMNAKFIVAGGRLPSSFEKVAGEAGDVHQVYRNPYAQDRAWFVDNIEVIPDPDAAVARLTREGFDPGHEAILLEQPDFRLGAPDSARSVLVPTAKYTPHSFEIVYQTAEPSFLVISEIWYPQGWEATLDGESVRIYRTDFALRGVAAPAGQHTIRMEYNPPEIAAGFTISYVSLAILALLTLGGGYVVWRRRKTV